MLKQPFSGKELWTEIEVNMGRQIRMNLEAIDEAWEQNGKQKKQAWNNLAKLINQRMIAEKADPV